MSASYKFASSSSCSPVLILLLLTALFLILVIDCALDPQRSLISLSSQRKEKPVGFSIFFSSIFDKNRGSDPLEFVDEEARVPLHSSNSNSKISSPDKSSSNVRTEHHQLQPSSEDGMEMIEASGKSHSRLEIIEASLAKARSYIKEAAQNRSMMPTYNIDYIPQGPVYRNANAYHRSYLEMERLFKIYVYEEGELPLFHNGPCKSIYTSEGRFIHEMENGNMYRTKDPEEALVYFLPFSVVMMVHYLYIPDGHNRNPIGQAVTDYINLIAKRHPFWNRSLGADHFMLSCHDWGPYTTYYVPYLFNNSIRVLCNANISEGYNPSKDASLPEIHLKLGEITGLIGGLSPSRRSILAFFAGRLHGHIRYLLLKHWEEKDNDVQVFESLPAGVSYEQKLKNSRFCLCPSGYEVASPRVVEAIYAECVPVLISSGYVPPFSDVLNWNAFSVTVRVEDIPNIKKIMNTHIWQWAYRCLLVVTDCRFGGLLD